MRKSITGYCPTQNKDYSVSIDYIDASTLQETCFEKGRFRCEHNIYGDKCSIDCPIFRDAPSNL